MSDRVGVMRPIRDDSGERNGWWIGERFVPKDGSDLTERDAEIKRLQLEVAAFTLTDKAQGAEIAELQAKLYHAKNCNMAGKAIEDGLREEITALREKIVALQRAVLWLNDNCEYLAGEPDDIPGLVVQARRAMEERP
jgi:hypothetical protein